MQKQYSSFKEAIEATTPAQFMCFGNWNTQLRDGEYFALCVTDYQRTPHTIAEENGVYIVGIEKTSGGNGWYISKRYSQRANTVRGKSVVLKIDPENLSKFCQLK